MKELYVPLKQTVAVAVKVEVSSTPQLQPGLGVALGIEFYQLDSVCGHIGHKRDKMLLGHRVGDRDKMLILHLFDGEPMGIVIFFRLQGRQGNAAAADHRIAGAVNDIAADGANIEFAPQHIGGYIFVGDLLTVHQLDHGDAQRLCQRLQQGNIRQALGRLPLGDGLAADADSVCQLRLGQFSAFP